MEDSSKPNYSIASVENALYVLQLIAEHHSDMSAIEIYSRTGLPKASIHKILQTLKKLEFIDQNPKTNHYFVTMKLLQLGYNCINRRNFFSTFYPYAKLYNKKFNCPISLDIYSGRNSVTVYSATGLSNQIIDMKSITGYTSSIYASATSRLLLSTFDNDTSRDILKSVPLIPYTDYTVCDIEALIRSLDKIRKNGYCMLSQESYYGFDTYAFPLKDYMGEIVGSLTLVLRSDNSKDIITEDAAKDILETLDKVRIPCN